MSNDDFDCDFHPELIHPSVFVAESAIIIGDVSIGAESSVWFGAIIRGDVARVTIGQRCNAQDGAIIHSTQGQQVVIGNGVTMAHGAIVHASTIADNVMIATRSTVLDKAYIGENSIIGAGAVVIRDIPPNCVAVGNPATVIKELDPERPIKTRGDWMADPQALAAQFAEIDRDAMKNNTWLGWLRSMICPVRGD